MNRSIALSLIGLLTIAPVMTVATAIGVQAQAVDARKVEADRLLQKANQHFSSKQFQEALTVWKEALTIYRVINDKRTEGRILIGMGITSSYLRRYYQSIDYYEKSLEIARELKDKKQEGIVFGELGRSYFAMEDHVKAISFFDKKLDISRSVKDQKEEILALYFLGKSNFFLGQYRKAIEYQKQRLLIIYEIKDKKGEEESLHILAASYSGLGEYLKSIEYQEKRLLIIREIEDEATELSAIKMLAMSYEVIHNLKKSIYLQEKCLNISRKNLDIKEESHALNNLGRIHRRLDNYSQALEYHQKYLDIARSINDQEAEGIALSGLGTTYNFLGNYYQALDYHQKHLKIARKLKNKKAEGIALNGLGAVYNSLGNYYQASEYYNKNLKIARETKDQGSEGEALSGLGATYWHLEKYNTAIEYHQKHLRIANHLGDQQGKETAIGNIGLSYRSLGNYSKSIEYQGKALYMSREVKDFSGEVAALNNIGYLFSMNDNMSISISFYKQSINIIEIIRQKNQDLDISLRAYYIQRVSKIYFNLANLLLQKNRIIEALQVLDLLKVQDLQDFLNDVKGNDRTAKGIELFPQEQAILTAFNNNSTDLNTFLKSSTVQTQTQYLKANAANQNLQLNTYSDLQTRIKKLGKNVALFYPLILDDRLELVILTNDRPPIRKPIAIPKGQLKTEIETFRKQLQNRDPLIKTSAQNLYQKIIQPIEAELKAAKVNTIVYAPDDIMRYIPLAALHDGKQWLAENYQINYLTALALTPIEPDKNTTPRVLAAALTEEHKIKVLDQTLTFPALQFTQPEIENLAKTLPNTTQLLNPTFNRQTLITGIPNHTILHLATHGHFVPNSPDQSIILLGDGTTLNLREIEQQWKLPNTSLVVLSACETAIGGKLGNGIEILGFGYQMQRIGSRASISSLWTIDDGGTQGFMNTFYTEIKQGKTIAAAVQNTQKAFINGQITTTSIRSQLRANAKPDIPDGIPTDLTHPYYWAPFLLIGNGL